MKPETILKHDFVEFIPGELKPGTIYISIRFGTASHLCCCGCGNKVVTPLRPTDWKLIFDGKTVSLDPSIGNWSFACKSHYWIRRNQVVWAAKWSEEMIQSGRNRDLQVQREALAPSQSDSAVRKPTSTKPEPVQSVWRRLKHRIFGK